MVTGLSERLERRPKALRFLPQNEKHELSCCGDGSPEELVPTGSPALPLCSWRSEEIMYCQSAGKAAQTDPGHRTLYVLAASLTLVVIGMIAVALTA